MGGCNKIVMAINIDETFTRISREEYHDRFSEHLKSEELLEQESGLYTFMTPVGTAALRGTVGLDDVERATVHADEKFLSAAVEIKDQDFRTTGRVIGAMLDGYWRPLTAERRIRLEHSGVRFILRQGYFLPHDDGVDDDFFRAVASERRHARDTLGRLADVTSGLFTDQK